MFIDISGMLSAAHVRDMRRSASAFRAGRPGHHDHAGLRDFFARTQLGPVDNYRSR